jgi:hypothetical protein
MQVMRALETVARGRISSGHPDDPGHSDRLKPVGR